MVSKRLWLESPDSKFKVQSISYVSLVHQTFPDISDLQTVAPSTIKLDTDKIRKGIPKYYPFLQPESKLIWDKFLGTKLTELITDSSPTMYKDLLRQLIAGGCRRQIITTPEPHPEEPIALDNSRVEGEVCLQ